MDGAVVVFRVQDKDGRGPWKPGFSHKWVEDRPDHDNLPPWFVEFGRVDRLVLYGETCGCGCQTLDQLRRWFTKSEWKKLKKYGYRAVKLEIGRMLASMRLCEDKAPERRRRNGGTVVVHNVPVSGKEDECLN